jgi:hypothetical protein
LCRLLPGARLLNPEWERALYLAGELILLDAGIAEYLFGISEEPVLEAVDTLAAPRAFEKLAVVIVWVTSL